MFRSRFGSQENLINTDTHLQSSTVGHTGTWLGYELNASGDMASLSVGSGILGKAAL